MKAQKDAKPPLPPLPSVGRIVLYTDPSMGDEQAAIITLVADPVVSLTVFASFQPPTLARAVRFNPGDAAVKGTWRWPPRT